VSRRAVVRASTDSMDRMAAAGRRPLSGQGRPSAVAHGRLLPATRLPQTLADPLALLGDFVGSRLRTFEGKRAVVIGVLSSARRGTTKTVDPQAVERALAVVHVLATRSRSFRTRQDDKVPVGVAKPNKEVILGLLDGAWIQTYFAQPPMLGFHR